MKELAELGELEGRKRNHSTRKTFATTLVQAGRPPTEIAALAGWKNIATVNEYSAPSVQQQAECSDIIAGLCNAENQVSVATMQSIENTVEQQTECSDIIAGFGNAEKPVSLATMQHTENNMNINDCRYRTNPFAVMCGATVTGGTVNINIYSGKRKWMSSSQENSQE